MESTHKPSFHSLAVVVPMLNEEKWIYATLHALSLQRDQDFSLYVVDNGSTDDSARIVTNYIRDMGFRDRWFLIDAPRQGASAASDVGFRKAIEDGAEIVLRTDADCIPDLRWTNRMRDHFDSGQEFVAGRIIPRLDEGLRMVQYHQLLAASDLTTVAALLHPRNYGKGLRGVYVTMTGRNFGITSKLYLQTGGIESREVESIQENHILINKVRKLTKNYCYSRKAWVRCSTRHLRFEQVE